MNITTQLSGVANDGTGESGDGHRCWVQAPAPCPDMTHIGHPDADPNDTALVFVAVFAVLVGVVPYLEWLVRVW